MGDSIKSAAGAGRFRMKEAALGSAARRCAARCGRMPWSALLRSLFAKFRSDPHAIVHWMTDASPKDFATFAPDIVEHALANDPVAVELLRLAGGHVDALAQ